MSDRDHPVPQPALEHDPVEGHWRQEQAHRQCGGDQSAGEDVVGEPVRILEAVGESDAEQEGEEDLRAGLGQPQLLQQLVPVPVEALTLRLAAARVAGRRLVRHRPPRGLPVQVPRPKREEAEN